MSETKRLKAVGYRRRYTDPERVVRWQWSVAPFSRGDDGEPLTPLLPAQDLLDQAEAQLERLRPVVRAALRYRYQEPFFSATRDLTPEDRAWIEGESK